MIKSTPQASITRRGFLKGASLSISGAAMTGVLAACGAAESPATASQAGQHESTPAAQSGSMTADQMDAMHEAGVKAFVAGVKTLGTGNQPLQPKIENGVKVFELTCKKVPFEVTAGSQVEAWSYNGQVPGLRFA